MDFDVTLFLYIVIFPVIMTLETLILAALAVRGIARRWHRRSVERQDTREIPAQGHARGAQGDLSGREMQLLTLLMAKHPEIHGRMIKAFESREEQA